LSQIQTLLLLLLLLVSHYGCPAHFQGTGIVHSRLVEMVQAPVRHIEMIISARVVVIGVYYCWEGEVWLLLTLWGHCLPYTMLSLDLIEWVEVRCTA
jgi:hypothetical protein